MSQDGQTGEIQSGTQHPAAYHQVFPQGCKTPKDRYSELEGDKSSIHTRCEDYALWTIPSIFPRADETNSQQQEKQGPVDSIGPQAVNNLSNKIVSVLFPMYQPFFRLMVDEDMAAKIKADADSGDQSAQEVMDNIDMALALAEKKALRQLNYNHFRSEATNVAKALIVTGNSMMYYPEDTVGKMQVYSLRDYCVKRDLNGTVIEFLTRDTKSFSTFNQKIQDALRASGNAKYNHDDTDCPVTLITQVRMGTDGRYYCRQSADEVILESYGCWTPADLPWIILTWNRFRGEDYGRGLVEDYAGAFHGLDVLSHAFVNVAGICSDIKWLVNPASVLDVVELNNAPSGTYHSGAEGDIVAVQVNKQIDLAVVDTKIKDWQKQIGQAFLLFSAVQRDAERVTAEEIKAMVSELEGQHSGIYARLADEWQMPTAKLSLKKVKVNIGDGKEVYPQIITGLDSLSRSGDMDNLRLFMQDCSLMNELPPSLQEAIDPVRFMQFCGVRRGVEYQKFTLTSEQVQQNKQAQIQQAQNLSQQQIAGEAAGQAAVQSMKQ